MIRLKMNRPSHLSLCAPTLYDIARAGAGATINIPLSRAQAHGAALAMIERGGSFSKHIGNAYLVADAHNAEILQRTFADIFKQHLTNQ